MEFRKAFFFACLGFGLVACAPAPRPQPIMPEPVYDKFGYTQIGGGQVCIPSGQQQTPGAANLPSCESRCPAGTQLDGSQSAATHATSQRPLCVQIPGNQPGDRPQGGQPGRTQGSGTPGAGLTRG